VSAPTADDSNRSATSSDMSRPTAVLGWREWVRFPDFGGVRIKAKVDTGAKTSALHASNIEIFEQDGRQMVGFDLHKKPQHADPVHSCSAPLIARRRIRNSGGFDTYRYIILANIKIGTDVWPVEISLTQRDRLKLGMLLGRTALEDRYLVDPAKSYLGGE